MLNLPKGERSVKLGLAASVLALFLVLAPLSDRTASAQNQQPAVPDAPTPQAPAPLPGLNGSITPGEGAGASNDSSSSSATSGTAESPSDESQPPAAAPPPSQPPDNDEQTTAPGGGPIGPYVIRVNFVEVPVTVKDTKGHQVAGLTFRDFRVYENGTREWLNFFSVDSQPLSVAFVIDQSLPSNVMEKVNDSLGAIQGALSQYDAAAVFTYGNGPKELTGFTGAQSERLPYVLSQAKATGTDAMVPINDGPFGGCSISVNGNCSDPNLQVGGSTGGPVITIPKEIHTLNDAILAAAQQLSTVSKDRRRVIYVISDGKEYGSRASWKEVVRYLQTNKIAVYATLVGDSARWGEGWIDRFHLPFQMYDNILYKYTLATGGDTDAEGGVNGIEKSYAKIAEEARTQYTLGYNTNEPMIDGKYRSIDVRVSRPGLTIIAKRGYYPSGQDYR